MQLSQRIIAGAGAGAQIDIGLAQHLHVLAVVGHDYRRGAGRGRGRGRVGHARIAGRHRRIGQLNVARADIAHIRIIVFHKRPVAYNAYRRDYVFVLERGQHARAIHRLHAQIERSRHVYNRPHRRLKQFALGQRRGLGRHGRSSRRRIAQRSQRGPAELFGGICNHIVVIEVEYLAPVIAFTRHLLAAVLAVSNAVAPAARLYDEVVAAFLHGEQLVGRTIQRQTKRAVVQVVEYVQVDLDGAGHVLSRAGGLADRSDFKFKPHLGIHARGRGIFGGMGIYVYDGLDRYIIGIRRIQRVVKLVRDLA